MDFIFHRRDYKTQMECEKERFSEASKMTRAFCSQDVFASFIGQICSCRNTAVEKRNKTACCCASRSDWVFMEEITASKQQASFNLNVFDWPSIKTKSEISLSRIYDAHLYMAFYVRCTSYPNSRFQFVTVVLWNTLFFPGNRK